MDALEAVGGFVALLSGVVAVAAGVARFSVRGRTVHAARRARRVSLAEAREGVPVRIVGRVRLLDHHLVSPLTGRRCCYYHARAVSTDAEASAYSDAPGETRTPEENGCDFALDDGTGSALVRVEVEPNFLPRRTSAVIWPRLKSNASILWGELPAWTGTTPADEEAFRITQAERSEWTLSEWTLGDGDTLCVFGVPAGEPDRQALGESVYRGKPGLRVLRPPIGLNLLLSDHPDLTERDGT
jgi:hypothetical protein